MSRMFVSESTLNFAGAKVQLISTEGFSWETAFEPSATIESIKKSAIQYFYPSESSINPDQFRVIFPAEGRTLVDHHALHDEHLKDNEVLLFVRRRLANAPNQIQANSPRHRDSSPADSEVRSPTAAEIQNATQDLPLPVSPQSPASTGHHHHHHAFGQDDDLNVDFQVELRKIVISLISVMATMLSGNQNVDVICKELQTRITQRLKNSAGKPIEGTTFTYPAAPEVECTPMGIVKGLTEAKKREFRPNPKAVEGLREMGFADNEIVEGLRANKNSKDAACEWILAEKMKEPLEADDINGLDQTGHLFTSLVTAPLVRLGLNKPKTLLAFLSILESPASANAWLNDADTAPVLSLIFKIYHAERHAAPTPSPELAL